jgi:hypothetical protein
LLEKLLQVDPTKRIGYGPEDAKQIKRHEFFASIDFEELL